VSIEVQVNGIDSTLAVLDNASALIQNPADGLMQAVEASALPDVIAESQAVWGVETGEYSSSWQVQQISSSSVSLFNDSDHAAALEYGWTRGGTTISSPGVLYPTVENDVGAITQELESWLNQALQ
jgi:hypothetical protein